MHFLEKFRNIDIFTSVSVLSVHTVSEFPKDSLNFTLHIRRFFQNPQATHIPFETVMLGPGEFNCIGRRIWVRRRRFDAPRQ